MKNYGVDVEELKAPKPKRIFRAPWIEDWEQPLLKKNDIVIVAEIYLCEKYKGLTFYDPDDECQYTVYDRDLDWTRGRRGGWSLICQPHSDDFEDEPFLIGDVVIGLIADSE